jgi:MoaA/NifB/PqqE/SkfB family radical SAM enzyme
MTIAPNWHVVACKLLEMGTRLVTCTNLAKHFSPEEIQVLAQFTSITVSIDTIDAETSHTLRRGGDIRQILYNMLVINLCATQNNHNIHWVWNVVVCDKNISELINVCRLARMLNVRIIQFNDLQRTHPPMPDMADLRRIAELPDTHQAITMLTTCHNFCSNNHIILNDECLLKTLTPRP